MKIAICGLTITSSRADSQATAYRALMRELSTRGHSVQFLERKLPEHAADRDLTCPPFAKTWLYRDTADLQTRFASDIREADLVIVDSRIPDAIAVGDWVTATARGITAFYDINTPMTLRQLDDGTCASISGSLLPRYSMYLSGSGGRTLERLEAHYGARRALPLYSSVDTRLYFPASEPPRYDLGYVGAYSPDSQPTLENLFLRPAKQWREGKFALAGSHYPENLSWPPNVKRIENLPSGVHRRFYTAQRYTLSIDGGTSVPTGYSPTIHLFEAAACGTPIISNHWDGIDTFFTPGEEILISRSAEETLWFLRKLPEDKRIEIARRARRRAVATHSAATRAAQLEEYVMELLAVPA